MLRSPVVRKKANGVVTVVSKQTGIGAHSGERKTDAGGACKLQLAHAAPPVLDIVDVGHPGLDILRLARILSKGSGPSALFIILASCC